MTSIGPASASVALAAQTLQVAGSLADFFPICWACRWYEPFKPAFTIEGFKTTELGIALTHAFVVVLETFGLAPKGTALMHTNLTSAARGLYKGGSLGLFTPMLFFKVVKPLQATVPRGTSVATGKGRANASSPSPAKGKARDSSRARGRRT
jgi:hypothetical protein